MYDNNSQNWYKLFIRFVQNKVFFMHKSSLVSMALLHYITYMYLVIAMQSLLCETAQCACSCDLSIMIVGYFSSCFFLWSLCPLGLKSVVLYRLWHSVSSRCTFTIKELYVLPYCLVYTCYIQCTCVRSIDT